jgi:putative glutamine amidotransferase
LKALITQKEQLDSHGILSDNFESSYYIYFEQLGLDLFVLSNFVVNLDRILDLYSFDLIILTGGGSIPNVFYNYEHNDFLQSNRDSLEWKLMEYSFKKNIPIISICRGMQYINAFLGGKISNLNKLKKNRPIGIEHEITLADGTQILVNNYHNDGIFKRDLAEGLKILGLDEENGVIEAIYSVKLKWIGFQFHPERIMRDERSKNKCRDLIHEFIRKGGIINESYYFSSWTGNET